MMLLLYFVLVFFLFLGVMDHDIVQVELVIGLFCVCYYSIGCVIVKVVFVDLGVSFIGSTKLINAIC